MTKVSISILLLSSSILVVVNGQSKGESGQPYYQRQYSQVNYPNQQYQYQEQSRPQQNPQYYQPVGFSSRVNNDDPNAYNKQVTDFSTRAPPKVSKVTASTTSARPPNLSNRFDDRKLTWDEQLTQNTEVFSLTLFAFLTHYEDDNFLISPLSIHNLLVLISEGAEGNTYEQLKEKMGLINSERTRNFHLYSNVALNQSRSDVLLNKFSALIGDKNRPARPDYEDIVEKIYEADYFPVNFQNVDRTLYEINQKVSQNTNGQIQQAVSRDDLLKAQLILLSGINFQGRWRNVFNTTFTKPEPFKDIHDNQVTGTVNMMFQRGAFPFAAIKDIGCYFIELPYGRVDHADADGISMIVVLPKKGLPLFDAINNINTYGLKKALIELKRAKEEYEDDEVEVHLPRFEIDTSLNLVDTLQQMGITDVFDPTRANLSKINTNYYISSVLHKTKIRVDEKGTEAAAVTTSIFANKATPPKFQANRPFLYFIVDKPTRLILFAGVYKNPKQY